MIKKQYRQKMSTLRCGLKPEEVTVKSNMIMEGFLDNFPLENHDHYLMYLPVNNEVDTRPLLKHLLGLGKYVYVPRCHESDQGRMDFLRITALSDLKPGYLGIDEPCLDSPEFFVNHGKALCILPGLAFDRDGYRLGYGQGYFDRYFAYLKGSRLLLIGFAYAFQLVEHLPRDGWDIPVDRVITESIAG